LLLAVGGFLLFHFTWWYQGDGDGIWLPGLGLGIALVAWLGWLIVPFLVADLVLLAIIRGIAQLTPLPLGLADAALYGGQIGISWWLYHRVARGSRWLDDPPSATVFLLLVPGLLALIAACLQALAWSLLADTPPPFVIGAAEFWLSRMVGILVVTPLLIVTVTPLLLRYRLVRLELPPSFFGEREAARAHFGDRIEVAGLTFATSMLGLLLLWAHVQGNATVWMLWAGCLVLIVWTCVRQGLRGGCFCASVTSMIVIAAAQAVGAEAPAQIGIQGSLLAFCSSALLVGVSASWIRANETRYRHVVSRIPFVVYSARLPYGVPTLVKLDQDGPRRDSKVDIHIGPSISRIADVMLVSPACKTIFGVEPAALIGPFANWLERIEAEDRELVIASLTQLCLQKQPVTCEYRLRAGSAAGPPTTPPAPAPAPAQSDTFTLYRWVRDTLTPHYSEEGLVDGWEGLVEDITDQRALSHNLRKMTTMLQVLIANLPTGVYFVQAPLGYPLLVNARARHLLGQREDLSAGVAHLSRIYRLHRPDGTEYPAAELPVAKALRLGVTCRANDIVVHRGDGRKIPLITWAAPIDLHNTGVPDAAVWVLEDWTAMQQAENAVRESEIRLRAVIETMAEGVIVQDDAGVIIDCNPAACAILDMPREQMIQQPGLIPHTVCVKEDGSTFPRAEQPDQEALRNHQPARNVTVGLTGDLAGSVRWLLVNSVPLPVGPRVGLNPQRARVVTTFADITEQVKANDSLRHAKNKYQALIETLPFMLEQRDRDFNIIFLNPAATQLTGYSAQQFMAPGFCEGIIHADDLPAYRAAAEAAARGQSTRLELRFRVKDGSIKNVLTFVHPNFNRGEVVGSTSLVIDITTQRRLELELQQARHLELVGRLASGTVHDLNNLLAVIMGLAGLAKTDLPADHPLIQHLARIEDVGEQAAHLTGQLLAFGKKRTLQRRPVDLNTVVTQTVRLARSVLPAEIEVESVLDPTGPMVLGDENQFKQVVMNLCLNARDAMPQGGKLTLRTDRSAPPAAVTANGNEWVHLSIQDTGHGMPDDIRTRIFEPFFSTKERGTGLGLAVVQQIVNECGGHIDVWSQPGEGTRFDVWLVKAQS
jgi:PAS domain S-box-containing protein